MTNAHSEPASAGSDAGSSPGETNPGDPEEVGRQILLQRLADQPRSRSELEQWLLRKNVPEAISKELLDRFEQLGLIDDHAFARMWVDSRVRTKGLARRALAMELRRKGIDDDIAQAALDELDPEEERVAACRLVQKRLRSMSGLTHDVKVRRLVGMLARKGYSGGLAYEVVRDELSSTDG